MRKEEYNINIAVDAAKICRRSDNLVRKVVKSKRTNEVIVLAVMELKEGYDEIKERAQRRVDHFLETGLFLPFSSLTA